MSEHQTKAGNQECFEKLSILLLLSLLSLLSLFHSLYLDMLNNFCFYVYAQKSLSHSFTFTTFAAFTTFTTFTLSFNHSQHAEQVLFSSLCWKLNVYCWKLQCFFLDLHVTLACEFRVHWAGSQLKRQGLVAFCWVRFIGGRSNFFGWTIVVQHGYSFPPSLFRGWCSLCPELLCKHNKQ